jgi:hypothetical protein
MSSSNDNRNLRIYLNDHLAGSTGGLALARRGRKNSTDPDRTRMWESVAIEVEEDREVLLEVMGHLSVSKNPVKAAVSWFAEKAGRFKPNGQFTGPSDLGQFLELEMMLLGVTGKLSLWEALAQLDDPRLGDIDFSRLIERAESQQDRLNGHRVDLANSIFRVGERVDSEMSPPA